MTTSPVSRVRVRVWSANGALLLSIVAGVIARDVAYGYVGSMTDDEKPPVTDSEPARRKMVRPPSGGTAAGRGMGTQMKTADKKSMSSIQWIKRQLADPWSEKARAEGYRSRAAFKFSEIDDRFRLVKKGCRVIDLGAAPGGWVQVCVNRGAANVVGVDLLPIEPIPGSILIQADFTDPGVDQQLLDALGGSPTWCCPTWPTTRSAIARRIT
ncbi:Ribosomal RNA large subunit methyltransferase E [Brevundimonas sp. NIBR10]|nr:Ribosomal RNA large subunit methyltransferase E [Brevundimonas sp. NIBR10]